MLFLYRPRETRMPFVVRRTPSQQAQYNRQLQERFESTRRVPPAQPAIEPAGEATGDGMVAALRELGEMHRSGLLTDAEFGAAKSKLLAP
jgi:hypothetical protein